MADVEMFLHWVQRSGTPPHSPASLCQASGLRAVEVSTRRTTGRMEAALPVLAWTPLSRQLMGSRYTNE